MKVGYLKEFVVNSGDRDTKKGAQQRGNHPPPPLGVIEVIYAALRDTVMAGSKGVLTVAPMENCSSE